MGGTTATENVDQKVDDVQPIVPYYKLYQFATILDKLLIILGSLTALLCGIIQPYMIVLFGDVSGIILEYSLLLNQNLTAEEEAAASAKLYSGTQFFAIMTTVCALVTILATYVSVVSFTKSSLRQTFRMRRLFMKKTLNQDIPWHDVNQTGDFASIITDNVPKIEDAMGEKVGMVIFLGTTCVSGIVMAIVKGWQLGLICLVSLPLQMAIMGVIAWFSAKSCKQEMVSYGNAAAVAEEVLSAIRTVIVFDAQDKEAVRYGRYVKEAKDNNVKRCFFNALNQGFLWLLTFSCYALAFWYGVGLIIDERELPEEQRVYTPGNMIGVFFAALFATWNFATLAPYLEIFGTARGAASKLFRVLESEPDICRHDDDRKRPSFKADIIFEHVQFSYPSRPDVQILNDINLKIGFGETVALVGHSGSGKSTMVQLLQRLYDPNTGKISIDDVDVKDVNLPHLRRNVGVVSQEPSLFATTISENIRYGKLDATMEEIVEAAKRAHAHKFICNLPHGYQTVIGERGAQLSGGQKQRIAIARALIKSPDLLILDEATSALDTVSEAEVQQTLDAISGRCTKVIVAHRLSTIRNADRIVVFEKGVIVEEGSHRRLIEAKGAYYNMITSQGFTELNNELPDESKHVAQKTKSLSIQSENNKEIDEQPVVEEIQLSRNNWRTIIKIIKMNKPEWLAMLIGSLASIANGATLPIYGVVFGDMLGAFSIADNGLLRSFTNSYCLYFLYLGIAAGIGMFLQMYAFGVAGEKLTYRLRNLMFKSMLKQEIGWFDRKENGVGALCAQLSGDAAAVQGAGGTRLGIVFNSFATFVLSLGFGFYLDWRLTLIVGIFYPLVFFSISYEAKSAQKGAQLAQKLVEKSVKIAVEAIDNIRTVKALGCEQGFCDTYDNELAFCKRETFKRCHLKSAIIGLARSLQWLAYACGIIYGTQLLVNGQVDSATVFKILEVVISSSWSIGNALALSSNMQKGITSATRIFSLFKREPTVRNYSNAIARHTKDSNVEYSNLNFSYPTRSTVPVLNGLDLSVMYGKTVALVGDSGCGKSTLIQLLIRFYDPTSGNVKLGDDNIRMIDMKCLRSHLGLVSQEPNLFDLTIAENISYGVNDRKVTMTEIQESARAANIHNFVVSLPTGYETRLGSKGKQLSGGQKQRIAIARALLRNPKILLLDEATSALDNESEKLIQEALDNARKGRTCITIAHRLTTIQDADLICVVKAGQIAEMGTHSQLLALKGCYYEYYKLQSGQE